MRDMVLSIIIPVYNVEKYVERCLKSCMTQDIPLSDYELVIVNDGSKDRSLGIVTGFAKNYPNIRIISQENAGLSAARNAGLDIASGEFVMFLDSDDRIASDSLGRLVGQLVNESPDVLVFRAADDVDGEIVNRHSYPCSAPTSGRKYLELGVDYCNNVTFSIWRRKFLTSNGLKFFRGIYHEDTELAPRAFYLAEKVSYSNDVVYYVTANPSSITRSFNPKRSFDLIEVVCPHLSQYSESVDAGYKVLFDDIISVCVNNALLNIVTLPSDDRRRLNAAIFNHRDLFSHLASGSKKKYRLEARLFGIFPRHTVQIYKLLQLANR